MVDLRNFAYKLICNHNNIRRLSRAIIMPTEAAKRQREVPWLPNTAQRSLPASNIYCDRHSCYRLQTVTPFNCETRVFASCVYQFVGLIEDYLGGGEMMWLLVGDGRIVKINPVPLCCCFVCCRPISLNRYVRIRCKKLWSVNRLAGCY